LLFWNGREKTFQSLNREKHLAYREARDISREAGGDNQIRVKGVIDKDGTSRDKRVGF